MTLPDERVRAVNYTREFLVKLASREIKRVPDEVREEARRLLKHYPYDFDMNDPVRAFGVVLPSDVERLKKLEDALQLCMGLIESALSRRSET